MVVRDFWISHARRLARPVLGALAEGRLSATMPVEHRAGSEARRRFTPLEAFGRLMAGLAPWLDSELPSADAPLAEQAAAALDHATDPSSPDFMPFATPGQPLVDAAFLAQGLLRGSRRFWLKLAPRVRTNVVRSLAATRATQPPANNWVLFSAMIETFLSVAGEPWDAKRVEDALQQHEQWYCGDGAYGDGLEFHWDFYNSFVIHPMLLDITTHLSPKRGDWAELGGRIRQRAARMAEVLERMIAPDGSFPPIGRSLTYRGGAFHLLAHLALAGALPASLPPAQVRSALTAVLRRTLDVPGTYSPDGWLRIGLSGHQPSLAEPYINTGSLYLASTLLLPLGLPANDPFWSEPPVAFT